MATLVFTGRQVVATRKAIKEMAQAGGHHEVKVDMQPPSDRDAQDLLYMASGATLTQIAAWRGLITSKRYDAQRYPTHNSRGRRRHWADYDADADRLEMMGPNCRFKPDPHYELRMAEWAEEVMSRNV